MECQNRGSRRAPASRSSSSTHTPIGAFKVAAALGTLANTCIVARDLINALHNVDRRGKEEFSPRRDWWGAETITMRGEGRGFGFGTQPQPTLVCAQDRGPFRPAA